LDESIYSPASVEKYKARLEEIGLSVYELSNDTQETLANKIQQFQEAKNLLELAKVIGLVTPFDPIEVELNATKVVLPVRARVKYDNGKVANLVVQWETVDTSKEGRVLVKGTVYDADGNSTGCIIECPVDVVSYDKNNSEEGEGSSEEKDFWTVVESWLEEVGVIKVWDDVKGAMGCASSVMGLSASAVFTCLGVAYLFNEKRRRK